MTCCWMMILVLLGSSIDSASAQTSCADQGVTDSDSCTTFCGGDGSGVPNAVYLDSGTCTCLGCLFCSTCTGGPATGGTSASPSGGDDTGMPSDASVGAFTVGHFAAATFPVMGLGMSMLLYRNYRRGRADRAEIPLVAEDMPASGYGALEDAETTPLVVQQT
eukprot:CAMPEP_0114228244 /NCGR_PEP_ID=MMETSP0058-20121206/2233_1 /TAXON_ID=36894 /ORGANISM="Pyramimonas parkeae, CCMP726" /LENGTH=162 /DNA_ID=CAMNT_0001339165 /DNA_START=1132 /DNA_END=1620 /DNA_ORIENTATION=-